MIPILKRSDDSYEQGWTVSKLITVSSTYFVHCNDKSLTLFVVPSAKNFVALGYTCVVIWAGHRCIPQRETYLRIGIHICMIICNHVCSRERTSLDALCS